MRRSPFFFVAEVAKVGVLGDSAAFTASLPRALCRSGVPGTGLRARTAAAICLESLDRGAGVGGRSSVYVDLDEILDQLRKDCA